MPMTHGIRMRGKVIHGVTGSFHAHPLLQYCFAFSPLPALATFLPRALVPGAEYNDGDHRIRL